VIALFHKEFVKTGVIGTDVSRIPNASFEKRTDGDYEDYYVFAKEEVEELAQKCALFIREVQQVLDEILKDN